MVSVNGALCFQLWREWSTNKAKSIQCFQASPLSYVELRDLGGGMDAKHFLIFN